MLEWLRDFTYDAIMGVMLVIFLAVLYSGLELDVVVRPIRRWLRSLP